MHEESVHCPDRFCAGHTHKGDSVSPEQNMCTMKEIVHRLDRFWAELTMVTLYRPDKLCARRKRIDREDFGLDTRR